MGVGTWRSGRTSPSGFVLVGYGRHRPPPGLEALLRGVTAHGAGQLAKIGCPASARAMA